MADEREVEIETVNEGKEGDGNTASKKVQPQVKASPWCCVGGGCNGSKIVEDKERKGPSGKASTFKNKVDLCCEAGSCCFGEFLQSGENLEGQFGPLLEQVVDKIVHVPAHSTVEITTTLELGDSLAWAIQVVPSGCIPTSQCKLKVSSYWLDHSENQSVNPSEDAFGIGDFWPGKLLSSADPASTGVFTVDGEKSKRASVVISLDNTSSSTEKKSVRLTLQQRGSHMGLDIKTPFGVGTVTEWTGSSFVADLGYGITYLPSEIVSVRRKGEQAFQTQKNLCFVLRGDPSFRFQHIHKPYKRFPSLETMGLNVVAGAFDRSENAHEKLWDALTEAERELLRGAFDGFDMGKLVDYHVHIVGSGQSGSGCYLTPKMTDPFKSPFGYVKLKAFMSAAGITLENSDEAYERRLTALAKHCSEIAALLEGNSKESLGEIKNMNKMACLAFEKTYGESGEERLDRTTMHIPNNYAFDFSRRNQDVCVGTCSIHPYRLDCELELERCHRRGIRIIKWLPNSMMIDPLSEKCDRFYKKAAQLGMIILSHTGEEHSVSSAGLHNEFGNPLRLRRALDHGVRVIAAHMATEGTAVDLDKVGCSSRFPPREQNFKLLMRLFHEPKYDDLLFADFSAVIAIKRAGYVSHILDATEIHSRLVYGSDYPVPCLNFGVVTRQLQMYGLINTGERKVLQKIYKYNPLLFDIACKRFLKSKRGNKFPNHAFYENPKLQIIGHFLDTQSRSKSTSLLHQPVTNSSV